MNKAPLVISGLAVLATAAYLIHTNPNPITPAQSAPTYQNPTQRAETYVNSPEMLKQTTDSIAQAVEMCQSGVKEFKTANYEVKCNGFPNRN